MEKQRNITSNIAFDFIKEFCEAENTGTVYLVTEKNIMGQIMISQGEIFSVHYLTNRGIEALEFIFKTKQFSMFNMVEMENIDLSKSKDLSLPLTQEILETIDTWVGSNKIRESTGFENTSIASVIDLVTAELTIHLGPIASILCEQYFKEVKSQKEIMTALDNITKEIDGVEHQAEFKRIVMKKMSDIVEDDLNQGHDANYDRSYSFSQVYEIVVSELSLYLGPIAPILCGEFLRHTKDAADIVGCLDKVANKIEDNSQRVEFKSVVLQKIQKLP